jgi:MiaB-like tRNA modifying enzyme
MESYGCSANQADQEMMLGLLKKNGFSIVGSPQDSNVNIINTCIVKTPTHNRMIFIIKKLTKLKKPLVVAGCMTNTERKIIERINPKASLIGPNSIQKIVKIVKKTVSGDKIVFLEDLKEPKICLPRVRKKPVIDIVEIASGCIGNCSFCQVKFAKGKLFSYPIELIVKEIKQSLKQGCKEIWITSQDCGCWGFDINSNLSELMKRICKIKGKFFIRVGMMNPNCVKNIFDDIIDAYKSKKIFKFIHLPVQSGSDRILKKMNRPYKVDDFKYLVNKFKKHFPLSTISTDIIVGFSGESEKDFQKTIELIKDIKPDVVNISKFNPRPGTKAKKMKQLPVKIIKKRAKELMKITKQIQLTENKKWIDWKGEILVDDTKNYSVGRNFAYKPVVLKKGKLGEFRSVLIESISHTSLFEK